MHRRWRMPRVVAANSPGRAPVLVDLAADKAASVAGRAEASAADRVAEEALVDRAADLAGRVCRNSPGQAVILAAAADAAVGAAA